ncbi:recombinase family protein [Metabacillus halosaccharovorans]|uniref:Recombinase family protein n=1 Tax=Metabacillus halosaccharovorans TaxID=930124 RepID=A0ABT3DDW4_9BACI|nr:recombinase family protein [Metabacillus halosaccharovorans]MCV9884736.1 recombinase family protein [Metabacillus halosaccharovorans]
MTKAALYIRVSTQEQVENYSIGVQTERLEAFCKSKGWDVYNTYVDGGYSGASLDRPDLQRLLKDLKHVDSVVVYKLDRLSRSQKDTLELIEEHFLKNNVDFVSITETLDTSTPFGKAMIGILSVFAQLERETIAERMRMGHIKRAENGLRGMGGNYDPTGYKRVDGGLVLEENEAQHIRRAFDLYEQTHSITQVQSILKEEGFPVWRFRRYRDILANPLYTGHVSFAGELYKGQHDPIVTQEQFDRVQSLLERHKGNNTHKAKNSLLTGLLRCQQCGESFVSYSTGISKKNKKHYYYYICRAKRFPSEYDEKCMNKNWSRTKLEEMIINELKQFSISKTKNQKKKRSINYEKLIKEIDKKMSRLIALYASDTKISLDLIEKQVDELNIEKERLIKKQEQLLLEDSKFITDDMLKDIQYDFKELDFKSKQVIVQTFINEIHIDGNNVIIDWRF